MNKSYLPRGWDLINIGNRECFMLIMGQSPPSRTYNIEGVGLPFFQGKAEFGNISPKPNKYCSEPLRIAEKDDVLISVRAPVAATNLAPCRCCIGRGLAAIRCKQKVLPRFLFYGLRSMEKHIAESVWDQGGGFTAIRREQLERVEIPLPPIPDQRRIVLRIEELTRCHDELLRLLGEAELELGAFTPAVLTKAFRGEM